MIVLFLGTELHGETHNMVVGHQPDQVQPSPSEGGGLGLDDRCGLGNHIDLRWQSFLDRRMTRKVQDVYRFCLVVVVQAAHSYLDGNPWSQNAMMLPEKTSTITICFKGKVTSFDQFELILTLNKFQEVRIIFIRKTYKLYGVDTLVLHCAQGPRGRKPSFLDESL